MTNTEIIEEKPAGLRKIRDIKPEDRCLHPEHNPAAYMVYEPGEYEYVCPNCGKTTRFIINPPIY